MKIWISLEMRISNTNLYLVPGEVLNVSDVDDIPARLLANKCPHLSYKNLVPLALLHDSDPCIGGGRQFLTSDGLQLLIANEFVMGDRMQ